MATKPKPFYEGGFYHIYNRGNRKQNIFLQTRDYIRFRKKIQQYLDEIRVNLLVYTLMPNHFHFLAQEVLLGNITKFIHKLSTSHSKYFNTKYEAVGSLFQKPFKIKEIKTEKQLLHVSRYIHLNAQELFDVVDPTGWQNKPVRSRVKFLRSYPWSSYPDYIGQRNENFVNKNLILDYFEGSRWCKKKIVKVSRELAYRDFVETYIDYPDVGVEFFTLED